MAVSKNDILFSVFNDLRGFKAELCDLDLVLLRIFPDRWSNPLDRIKLKLARHLRHAPLFAALKELLDLVGLANGADHLTFGTQSSHMHGESFTGFCASLGQWRDFRLCRHHVYH